MDDALLIEHARQNPDAFGILYRRYLTPLYRYLYRRLGNPHDAEDLTAQVFMEALEGLIARRYREGGLFYRLAVYHCSPANRGFLSPAAC
jgi:RNA polymerase sigma-70 factor (ECF subfamily)